MSKSFSLTGLPSDILTDDREYIRRIAVDPQQTSFEKNFQLHQAQQHKKQLNIQHLKSA